jgi:hypothetical protein
MRWPALQKHQEQAMNPSLSYAALGLALIGGTATASAQTVITRQIVSEPAGSIVVAPPPPAAIFSPELVATQAPAPVILVPPLQTVRTIETVRTVQPVRQARPSTTTKAKVVRSRKSNKLVTVRSTQPAAIRPARRSTIYRTIVRERVVPAPQVVERVVAAPTYAAPSYTQVVPATTFLPSAQVAAAPVVSERFVSAPVVSERVIASPDGVAVAAPISPAEPVPVAQPYRYVYEGDRILVVDPNTNIAVAALPR